MHPCWVAQRLDAVLMNVYDVYFADGTKETRTLMFFGGPPPGSDVKRKLAKACKRTDIVKITRPLAGDVVVWQA